MRTMARPHATLLRRWLKFNAVGAIGICVQLLAVLLLGSIVKIDSLCATALAVEAAVLHNFLWHEHFTWADRGTGRRGRVLQRLLAFNATTGAVSTGGNVLLVSLLLRMPWIPLFAANLASIAACSIFNFLINDKLVFRVRNAVSPASH